jgi:LAS superfamily LD-carboxypeptidase LdcB
VDARRDPRFAPVPSRIATREGLYGHNEAVEALTRMADAAQLDGVELRVVSAFRSFEDQTRIWNNKWTGQTRVEGGRLPETIPVPVARALKILEYSAMPGTSRHHWGTDFDFNNLNNAWFETGEGKQVYGWLSANAAAYGFCQTYTAKGPGRPEGYNEERWHWTYVPAAGPMLQQFLQEVGYERLAGFEGADVAREIDILGRYVPGINPACRG